MFKDLQCSKMGRKYLNMGGCSLEHHSPARMEYFRVNLLNIVYEQQGKTMMHNSSRRHAYRCVPEMRRQLVYYEVGWPQGDARRFKHWGTISVEQEGNIHGIS